MSFPVENDLNFNSACRGIKHLDPIVFDDVANKTYVDNYKHDVIYDHFYGALSSSWTVATDGQLLTSSAVNSNAVAANGAAGVLELTTGTFNNAWAVIHAGQNFTMIGGGYVHSFGGRFRMPLLSSAAQTFTLRIGLSNTVGASNDPTDGIYLRYSHGLNAGAFQLICRRAGAETVANTSVSAAAGQWVNFRIQTNEAADMAVLYLGLDAARAVIAATLNTGLPLSTTALGFFARIQKSAGNTARTVQLDFLHYDIRTSIYS